MTDVRLIQLFTIPVDGDVTQVNAVDGDSDVVFFFQAEDGIRDLTVTGVQTCALPIYVFWTVLGTAPNRQLVVEWRDVRYYDCRNDPNATIKFQVVFQEGSGNVLFNYANAVFGGNCSFADAGGSATVGVQVAPGLGTTWRIDQQLVEIGRASCGGRV